MNWTRMGRSTRRQTRDDEGFTLVELLIVMVIIAALAGGALPLVNKRAEQARRTRALSDIQALSTAIDLYAADMGDFPGTEEGLEVLYTEPSDETAANWMGAYLTRRITKDPWGSPYVYRAPGEMNTSSYDLFSYGKDGQEGGEGADADIVNWEEGETF